MWIDDLDGYHTITETVDVPIAGAEIVESEWELHALVEHGGIHVVQPPARVFPAGKVAQYVVDDLAAENCNYQYFGPAVRQECHRAAAR